MRKELTFVLKKRVLSAAISCIVLSNFNHPLFSLGEDDITKCPTCLRFLNDSESTFRINVVDNSAVVYCCCGKNYK